jgi:hypothetical protein
MGQRKVSDEDVARAQAQAVEAGFQSAGFHFTRGLDDGRRIYLAPLPNGDMRVGVAANTTVSSYLEFWDYRDDMAAWRAAIGWDGEGNPFGFTYHQPPINQAQVTPRKQPSGTLDPGNMSNAEILMRLVNNAVVATIHGDAQLLFKQLPKRFSPLTLEDAQRVIDNRGSQGLDFEFFNGASLKLDISQRPLHVYLYDRDNGEGAAARALGLDDHDKS